MEKAHFRNESKLIQWFTWINWALCPCDDFVSIHFRHKLIINSSIFDIITVSFSEPVKSLERSAFASSIIVESGKRLIWRYGRYGFSNSKMIYTISQKSTISVVFQDIQSKSPLSSGSSSMQTIRWNYHWIWLLKCKTFSNRVNQPYLARDKLFSMESS